jgi:Rrf2 family protein
MTLMSRQVDYALLILSHLHAHPEGGCAREVAGSFGISQAFVANILKKLCRVGFLTSHRGVKGGYTLLRSADTISLAELMEALGESLRLAPCSGGDPGEACRLAPVCPVQGPLSQVHERLCDVLRRVTLAELFRPAGLERGRRELPVSVS